MPYAEVAAFISDLSAKQAVAALALEFTILTAARTSEVTGMTWDEIDLARAVWTIPAKRMKAGNEHRIPLSNRAVEILEAVRKLGQSWVFSGNKGKLSSMAMAMLLRRMDKDVTVHGFRSAFRDWAAESTGYSHEVCEMALAHVIGNKAEAAYRRGDLFEKRRRLMDDWASFCLTPRGSLMNITSIRNKGAA
jgi:integrase